MSNENTFKSNSSATALLLKSKKLPKPVAAIPEDLLSTTAHKIENMNQDQLIEYVLGVRDEHGFSALKQGGALTRLMEINWTGSHSTFRKWVEKELGMRWNDARSKMKIYEKLLQSKVTEEQLEGLRWSKIAIIAPALSPENCAHWIAKAKEITLGELREMVEADQKASGEKGKSDVTTWCAKLHADQEKTWLTALDKVKAEVNTKFDAVAMDAVTIPRQSRGPSHVSRSKRLVLGR